MLNMNFEKKVVITTHQQPWIASPHAGVWRKPLAREDAERGHATSLVKFEAGASFSEHDHPLGEEILVLSGIFSDHSGDYQAGSYLRNPEGYKHAPFSKEGCVLFVKLHQFTQGDDEHIVIDTKKTDWSLGIGGLSVMPLYSYQGESTALVKWPKEERFQAHQHFGGEEVFV
ncbi:MAG: hypothetical protein ACI936_004095, partial [Paraglaciecola sp.]